MTFTTPHFIRHLTLTFASAVLAAGVLAGCAPQAPSAVDDATGKATEPIELRIGYQRGTNVWTQLKAQETLDKRFGSAVKVSWVLFTSGPPLLEALNAGSIDVGSTGDTPPIFAQAAGVPLKYVAYTKPTGATSAILSPKDSSIRSVADLKGRKVAFVQASSAHLVVVQALQRAGLKFTDITPVFLQPAEARAAFQSGSVDAWAIWDPFMTSAKRDLEPNVLIDGTQLPQTRSYTLASAAFVDKHPQIVKALNEEIQKAILWARANLDEYAAALSKETKVEAAVYKQSLTAAGIPDQNALDEDTAVYQQSIADLFSSLNLIPTKLDVRSAFWFQK